MNERWIFVVLTNLCFAGCEKSYLDDEVRRLCAIDGGVKVHETVRLSEEGEEQVVLFLNPKAPGVQ